MAELRKTAGDEGSEQAGGTDDPAGLAGGPGQDVREWDREPGPQAASDEPPEVAMRQLFQALDGHPVDEASFDAAAGLRRFQDWMSGADDRPPDKPPDSHR